MIKYYVQAPLALFLLVFGLWGSPVLAGPEFLVDIDLDGTLVDMIRDPSEQERLLREDPLNTKRIVLPSGRVQVYRAYPGAHRFIERVASADWVTARVFSGGQNIRNIPLLKAMVTPSGKTWYELLEGRCLGRGSLSEESFAYAPPASEEEFVARANVAYAAGIARKDPRWVTGEFVAEAGNSWFLVDNDPSYVPRDLLAGWVPVEWTGELAASSDFLPLDTAWATLQTRHRLGPCQDLLVPAVR